VSGLCPSSGILENTKEHCISETDPVSETLCSFVFSRIPDDRQSPKSRNPECYTPLSEPFRFYLLSYRIISYQFTFASPLPILTEFTDTLLASQAFIFFLAGFETSSTTLSFCLHELALNPEVQERLREEIDSTLEKYKGKMTYDGIQSMTYLDQVVDGE
jgi:hypothetical protein